MKVHPILRWRVGPAPRANMRAIGVLLTALLGCAETVEIGRLPATHAERAERVFRHLNLPVSRARAGKLDVLTAPARQAPAARAVLTQLLPPFESPRPWTRLVISPTEARLQAERERLRGLRATLAALPGVVGLRLSGPPGARRAVVQVFPEATLSAADVEILMGPGARARITPLTVPTIDSPPNPERPSWVLSSAVGLLVLVVIGLLVHVRRLRKALGP